MPKKIQNKPDLFFGMALYLNAWFDLDSERDRVKDQKINRSMCFRYADDYDLSEDQRDDLWYYINRMDTAFLTWWQKKYPPKRQPKGSKRGNSQRVRQVDKEEG